MTMKRYQQTRALFRDARTLEEAYLGDRCVQHFGGADLSLSMARNSFKAHAVCAGYDRDLIDLIAERVFHPHRVHCAA
ncbi:MAG: hypothetical protein GC154_18250 [bacterium]|nr:hypothetical protein [bacterium]